MSSVSPMEKLKKYKRQLDAFMKTGEDDKVIVLLHKISKLDVTIEMIQETSIGKSVNSLTVKENGIGQKALSLVDKWKRLIEERVDQKYKSDDEKGTIKKQHSDKDGKKQSKNSLKTHETQYEKPRLKRTSGAVDANECQPPAKHSRMSTSIKARLPDDDQELLEKGGGQSFLDALNHKSSVKNAKKHAQKHGDDKYEASSITNQSKSATRGQKSEKRISSKYHVDDEESEYSVEVLHELEDICSVIEEKRRCQMANLTQKNEVGGRTYAVMSVFSGRKSNNSKGIPTIIEKFQHLLHDNVESVEYIGNLPYEILQPVLKKLTPDQLERFENFNPMVIEKSDSLWRTHVVTKCPNMVPDEFESWREVYLGNRDAMNAKFEQCVQKFSTNVAKMKQEEHKTKFVDACLIRPGRRSNSSRLMPISTPVSFGERSKAIPLQKAPLMQKTMKMVKAFKGNY